MGLGHTRRNLVLAAAVESLAPHASVLTVTGVREANDLGRSSRTEILSLPGLRKVANGHYVPRRLAVPMPDLIALRSGIIESAVREFRPDVMLVDRHPLGINGELRAAL